MSHDVIEAMKHGGPINILPQMEYVPPRHPSAMVHIHEDLYLDAACVVSVEAIDGMHGPCLKVVWQEHTNQCAAKFFVMPIEDVRQLAREIVQRVNDVAILYGFARRSMPSPRWPAPAPPPT